MFHQGLTDAIEAIHESLRPQLIPDGDGYTGYPIARSLVVVGFRPHESGTNERAGTRPGGGGLHCGNMALP